MKMMALRRLSTMGLLAGCCFGYTVTCQPGYDGGSYGGFGGVLDQWYYEDTTYYNDSPYYDNTYYYDEPYYYDDGYYYDDSYCCDSYDDGWGFDFWFGP